ncbi:hypothetical protein [Acidovorax sp. sic0104]|uniref:hypothetical protein n=1 Tax=Acidovorax sp. sic0104 TaxID=2854784 RepID=UPI001C43E9BF|nr:hypothetical protein [Acidovorax sp. sic0104]MBV7542037.1 hypothetical protein [Acidovorax sp. sic0104]
MTSTPQSASALASLRKARLLAIVAVSPEHRVACQSPGCGHGVYAAIHIVEDAGQLLVMGSTCFAKHYGGALALGMPAYSAGGGNGRMLTEAERLALVHNTAALLAAFKAEHDQAMAEANARLKQASERRAQRMPFRLPAPPPRAPTPTHPWPWQHSTNNSVAVVRSPEGQAWIRVQHSNGSQRLVPWPAFEGWEYALPPSCGAPDHEVKALAVPNIVTAMLGLRMIGFTQPEVSRWPDVLRLVPPAATKALA